MPKLTMFMCVRGNDKTINVQDERLEKFLSVAKKFNITLNKESTCLYSTDTVEILGYVVSKLGEIKPDPERLWPLKEMPSHITFHPSVASYRLVCLQLQQIWIPN